MRKQLFSLFTVLIISSAALFFAEETVAETDQVLKKQVLYLLEGHHWQLDEKRFKALGENVDLILIEVIQEDNPLPYIPLRAMRALSLYSSPAVANFFEQYLRTSVTKRNERKVLAIYIKIFEQKMPDRVETVCADYLKHNDPHIRVLAAKSLMRTKSQRAQNLVDTYLENTSTSEWEKSQLTAYR